MINLRYLQEDIFRLSNKVKLVAVSKNVTCKEVLKLIEQGQIDFGENRVQEMAKKSTELSRYNLNWHMIGRLQTNKINQLINLKPKLWQSCDSYEKAIAVDKRLDYQLDTLLQINSANEISKQGVDLAKAIETYLQIKQNCKNINLIGIMSIGANTENKSIVQNSFENAFKIYEKLIKFDAKICSMGMSDDYKLAIKCGSNMIRLGSMLYT